MDDKHNKAGMITLMVVLTFNVLFFVYISFIHEGVNDANINKPAVKGEVKL
ncbi:MAG: hypothetical protein H7A24_15470 [Leptospiraceae bacterium]|nr:hypothetical protein [Leptospiraceae bacterium]MCP5513285.1 hypothetical protein [Leptospiraceae bacterium]